MRYTLPACCARAARGTAPRPSTPSTSTIAASRRFIAFQLRERDPIIGHGTRSGDRRPPELPQLVAPRELRTLLEPRHEARLCVPIADVDDLVNRIPVEEAECAQRRID